MHQIPVCRNTLKILAPHDLQKTGSETLCTWKASHMFVGLEYVGKEMMCNLSLLWEQLWYLLLQLLLQDYRQVVVWMAVWQEHLSLKVHSQWTVWPLHHKTSFCKVKCFCSDLVKLIYLSLINNSLANLGCQQFYR